MRLSTNLSLKKESFTKETCIFSKVSPFRACGAKKFANTASKHGGVGVGVGVAVGVGVGVGAGVTGGFNAKHAAHSGSGRIGYSRLSHKHFLYICVAIIIGVTCCWSSAAAFFSFAVTKRRTCLPLL